MATTSRPHHAKFGHEAEKMPIVQLLAEARLQDGEVARLLVQTLEETRADPRHNVVPGLERARLQQVAVAGEADDKLSLRKAVADRLSPPYLMTLTTSFSK